MDLDEHRSTHELAPGVAVIITAGWVFFKLSRGEAASLELRSSLESTLDSTLAADSSAQWCDPHYRVTVRNEGITSFDVTKVHIPGLVERAAAAYTWQTILSRTTRVTEGQECN
jgi:hypothetical protein